MTGKEGGCGEVKGNRGGPGTGRGAEGYERGEKKKETEEIGGRQGKEDKME